MLVLAYGLHGRGLELFPIGDPVEVGGKAGITFIAPGPAIDCFPYEVEVSGMSGGLYGHVNEDPVKGHVPAVLGPPWDDTGRIEIAVGKGLEGVLPGLPVEHDDRINALFGGGPHVGVGLGFFGVPRKLNRKRPAEHVAEIARLDAGEMLDQAQQVGPRWGHRAPQVVFAQALELADDLGLEPLECRDEVGLGIGFEHPCTLILDSGGEVVSGPRLMLRIEDLHKSFGRVTALAGCTFEVQRGRMLGFLGPNGAGKTTAMRAIFDLIKLDRGTITWDGTPITPEQRLRFGYMPESRGLYPKMRVADQLSYFGRLHGVEPEKARSSANTLLERLGLADRSGDKLEKLSHGNQQRVQLAAALINEPELLVLDEPFSGLDPLGVATMAEVLKERAQGGAAVLFSSHQLDLVEDLCEDVAIINKGEIVLTGVVDELKDASPIRHLEVESAEGPVRLPTHFDQFVTSREGNRVVLRVPNDLDIRPLMSDGLGTPRRFIFTTPSLSEIFLEAVRQA